MRQHVKRLSENIAITMPWRLALSICIGLIGGASAAVTWAYQYGDRIVARTEAAREDRLRVYVTHTELLRALQEMEQRRSAEYREIRDLFDQVLRRLPRER